MNKMNSNSYAITKIEMTVTLISMLIGVGILTLPRTLVSVVGTQDGWISVILGAILNMFLVILIVRLQRNFPGKTFIGIFGDESLKRWIGKLFSLLFLLYFVLLLGYEARILTIVVRIYLLDRTPSEVTAILIFLATTYAATKGVQGIVHLNLMFLPIVASILFFIITFNIGNAKAEVLFPIAAEGLSPILMGVSETALAFLGIEILFFFLAYVKQSELSAIAFNVGIGAVACVYISTVLLCYMVVGIETTGSTTFPLVALAKEVEIIEGLVERIEPFMISVWIMSIFNTMAICHFLGARIVQDSWFKRAKISTVAIWITFFAFMITFIPESLPEAFSFGDYVTYFGYGLTCCSIIIGYLLLFVNKVGKAEKSEVV